MQLLGSQNDMATIRLVKMTGQEIFTVVLVSILFIGLIALSLYALFGVHFWINSDLILRNLRKMYIRRKIQMVFEQDEEEPKIVYFYPKGKW